MKLAAICKQYGIARGDIRDDYQFWYSVDRSRFLESLDAFLADLRASKQPVDLNHAAIWFVREYKSEQRVLELVRDEVIAEAAAKRTLYLSIGIGAFGTLLAFLFLPLLIQIERNTRRLFSLSEASGERPTDVEVEV